MSKTNTATNKNANAQLLEIENGIGKYTNFGICEYVRRDAGSLLDAMEAGDAEAIKKILHRHISQYSKGTSGGAGPVEVKQADRPRQVIAHAAVQWLGKHSENYAHNCR